MPTPAVLIMARAPRPGECKTRLQPLLGAEGCARLQSALIGRALAWAGEIGAEPWIAFTPADAGEEVAADLPPDRLFPQRGTDLGERLADATERVLADHDGPLLTIGTDLPTLRPLHARAALGDLEAGCDFSLGPAADGGYYLAAQRDPHPELFALPPDAWGGPSVFELTIAAAHAAGLSLGMLRLEIDLDTPADARWLLLDHALPEEIGAILRAGR